MPPDGDDPAARWRRPATGVHLATASAGPRLLVGGAAGLLVGGAAGLLLGGTGCGLGGEPLGEEPLTLDDLGRQLGVEHLEAGRLGQAPLELGLDGGDELGLAVPCLLHGHEPRRHLLAHRRRMARGRGGRPTRLLPLHLQPGELGGDGVLALDLEVHQERALGRFSDAAGPHQRADLLGHAGITDVGLDGEVLQLGRPLLERGCDPRLGDPGPTGGGEGVGGLGRRGGERCLLRCGVRLEGVERGDDLGAVGGQDVELRRQGRTVLLQLGPTLLRSLEVGGACGHVGGACGHGAEREQQHEDDAEGAQHPAVSRRHGRDGRGSDRGTPLDRRLGPPP
jgi:hypothetical protein